MKIFHNQNVDDTVCGSILFNCV